MHWPRSDKLGHRILDTTAYRPGRPSSHHAANGPLGQAVRAAQGEGARTRPQPRGGLRRGGAEGRHSVLVHAGAGQKLTGTGAQMPGVATGKLLLRTRDLWTRQGGRLCGAARTGKAWGGTRGPKPAHTLWAQPAPNWPSTGEGPTSSSQQLGDMSRRKALGSEAPQPGLQTQATPWGIGRVRAGPAAAEPTTGASHKGTYHPLKGNSTTKASTI